MATKDTHSNAICTKWNYSFRWTDNHIPREESDPLRYKYDELGARALERLQNILNQKPKDEHPRPRTDMYLLLRENYAGDEVLEQLWNELHSVPNWVDWEQLERGQRFFYRYGAANIVGFALQGFLAENSASTGVVEVLVRTGGFSTKVLLQRLVDTFHWLIQVTHSLPLIQPGGEGHASTIRIRLLHASVRQRILKLVETRSGYFDVEQFGVPANTLDSIHSISTFCCNHMWLQLPRMGITPGQGEINDYIALFRYIGYLLGTPTDYFETSEKAKAVMESMQLHELHPTSISKIVTYNFIQSVVDLQPFNISRGFIEASCRWMNGDELCDALDLGRPGWYYYALFLGQCWLVKSLAVAQQNIPAFDNFMVKYLRNVLHKSVVEKNFGLKRGPKFDFKYVPQLEKRTGIEEDTGRSPSHGGSKFAILSSRPAECMFFLAFAIGSIALFGAAVIGIAALTLSTFLVLKMLNGRLLPGMISLTPSEL